MPDDEARGPLAEFTALRAEVDRRGTLQQGLFVLQLTAAGAIFSFALSDPARVRFLLILPLTSYALCGRYCLQHWGIARVGAYVRDSLSARVPGGLLWESWIERYPADMRLIGWVNPFYLAFPGASTLALMWVAPHVFTGRDGLSLPGRIGFSGIWAAGAITTALSVYMIWRITVKHRRSHAAQRAPQWPGSVRSTIVFRTRTIGTEPWWMHLRIGSMGLPGVRASCSRTGGVSTPR
ncbi:hypothetical protein [Nocardia sp. NPDC005825]|uniref:hypothetical protein n=1 Tax=unclassified Nocardia TaxID=2637762 RepID=UPI00340627F2